MVREIQVETLIRQCLSLPRWKFLACSNAGYVSSTSVLCTLAALSLIFEMTTTRRHYWLTFSLQLRKLSLREVKKLACSSQLVSLQVCLALKTVFCCWWEWKVGDWGGQVLALPWMLKEDRGGWEVDFLDWDKDDCNRKKRGQWVTGVVWDEESSWNIGHLLAGSFPIIGRA